MKKTPMSCSKHMMSHDTCPACRHNFWKKQSKEQHREQMRANLAPPPPPSPTHLGRNLLIGAVAIPVLVVIGLVAGLVMLVLALAGVLLQGLLAGALVGAVVGAGSYALSRHRDPDAAPFQVARPDGSLPIKQRARAAYASLDPTTAKAARHAMIAAAITAALVVLF